MPTIHVSPEFPLNRRMRKAVRRGKLQVVREGGENPSMGGEEQGGLQCHQCLKPAIRIVFPNGENNGGLPLCLDCSVKFQSLLLQQNKEIERAQNMVSDLMAGVSGVRFPKHPQWETQVIQYGGTTLNNIQVQNSNVGVLNTGMIGNVDNAIGVLKQNSPELAKAIKHLAEQVIESNDLSKDMGNKILELLESLSNEVSVPEQEGRKNSVIEVLAKTLGKLCSTVEVLDKAWQAIKAMLPIA